MFITTAINSQGTEFRVIIIIIITVQQLSSWTKFHQKVLIWIWSIMHTV